MMYQQSLGDTIMTASTMMTVSTDAEKILYQENERLRQQITTLEHDIATLTQAETSHREAASRVRSEFLAKVSHETRTPLNAIIGLTTLLLDSRLDKEQHEWVETILLNSEVLLDIINNTLDFANLETGRVTLDKQPFSIKFCIQDSLGLVMEEAAAKHLQLSYGIDPRIPEYIVGDRTRVQQILVNLISNAVKFTNEGAVRVSIWLDQTQNPPPSPSESPIPMRLHIAVSDTGIGIAHDDLSSLFQSFTQGYTKTKLPHQGTGLGLAISKRLVEMMDGTIWVESELDQGATFHVVLGVERVQDTPLPLQQVSSQTSLLPFVMKHTSPSVTCLMRILLAEDNLVNQRVALRLLNRIGYQADVVSNGEEVLAALQHKPYEVILMDMQMPHMDGMEATQRIRAELPNTQQPWIIALTAHTMRGYRETCLAKGMNDYISKPIQLEELVNVLRNVQLRVYKESDGHMMMYDHQQKAVHREDSCSQHREVGASGDIVCTPEPLERAVFEQFLLLMGEDNPELQEEVIQLFLSSIDTGLATMQQALTQHHTEMLWTTAHSLKSSSAQLGANQLAEIFIEIEQVGKMGNLDAAHEYVRQAEANYLQVRHVLEMYAQQVLS